MRKILFLLAASAAFGLAPFTARFGPVLGSGALIALAVCLAVTASGLSSLAVAGGAAGGFAYGMLVASSPAVAGAALAALAFGERTLRVRGGPARAMHLGAALLAGALSGSLAMSFALSPAPVRAVAVVVMAVLLALPLLVTADDPVAHALEGAALDAGGVVGGTLREAAELRRACDEELLDPATGRKARATWVTLLRLVDARARLSHGATSGPASAVLARVDERIADHVRALSRAYTAAGAAKAAEITLHDDALRGVEIAGECLEEVSRAIVDQA
jgi:MFS family permease